MDLQDITRNDVPAALGMLLAFGLGAVHALSPGHGKTLVAAYLVGTRGTLKHAAILGASVTVTHTVSVFVLGFATLFLTRFIVPQEFARWLSIASGITIVLFGAWLLRKRLHRMRHPHHHHHHHHHHDDLTPSALIALGAGGGLSPCPSALVLMLSAISLGKVALGLILLVAFSAGLAAVLTAIGAAVLYARRLAPASLPKLRWAPVASAVFIIVAGIVMTGAAMRS